VAVSPATLAVEVLLGIAVVTAWLCCLGILLMPNFYERLHYLSSVTTISSFSVLVAVVIREGWGQATLKTIVVCILLLLINAVVTHATARAARVRSLGHWSADPHEQVEGTESARKRRKGR
jgi:monovalent cation/proton antiporter MnhG/PhaG subunit